MSHDFIYIIQWWFPIFLLGLIFFPLTSRVFEVFIDRGYIFSKVLGIAVVSYFVFILNVTRILRFNIATIFFCVFLALTINALIYVKNKKILEGINLKLLVLEEILFFAGLAFWAFIRGHEPSINGLEKFMDFGFLNSILRTDYQPATDMWFPPLPINYYYFGHLATAILTKLSYLPSYITYNLMIATLFSFTFSLAFSLGTNLISRAKISRFPVAGGILSGALLAFGGNLHTIYTFFKPYDVDHPTSFLQLPFMPQTFPNSYWYPNATRFIPFTIHEFPIYSFVVSDLHGHVTDIMFVLLTIAMTYALFISKNDKNEVKISRFDFKNFKVANLIRITNFEMRTFLIAFMLSIMYMTNAWDGAIYMLLLLTILAIKNLHLLVATNTKSFFVNLRSLPIERVGKFLSETLKPFAQVIVLFIIFSLPFNIFFKPFANGVGILCAPDFLTKIGRLGPFLFEANHCQKTPFWQLIILYGFFYFFVISFIVFIFSTLKKKLIKEDLFVLALIMLSTLLIIIPEFIYLKDIYPAHYRANTMFKLVYQSFMMLMLVSSYVLVRIITKSRNIFFYVASVVILVPVLIYPYFATVSYYGDLKNYSGLDGIKYLKTKYPRDYDAIYWLNKNITGRPVVLEAQGDSYTDYERISANTGLPTVLGWTVHEWLWRGTYDIPAPRIAEVKNIYESQDLNLTKNLLKKYDVQYVYVGDLERQKYQNLDEQKFEKLGNIVFEEDGTRIYKISI